LELEQYKFRPIGKIFITGNKRRIIFINNFLVIEAKNLRGISQNTTIFVKMKHTPYILKTKKVLSSENPKWKQSYLM